MDDVERRMLASTFDLDAEGYDDGRPDYPEQAWEIVLEHASLGPGKVAVEIGAGTGQATARLLATGAAVFAIEPGAAMGDLLRRRFAGNGLQVATTSFEDAEIEPGSADAVLAATSFHWVDPVVGVRKLARILRPGAPLCLWWNVYRDPTSNDPDPVDELVRGSTALPNMRGLNGILDELALPRRLAEAGFVDVQARTVRWTGVHDERQLLALFRSFSDIRKRPAQERDAVLAKLGRLVRANGGSVRRRYTTPILLARLPA